MSLYEYPLISHNIETGIINQRANDGYINATALCKACNKEVKHYLENKSTKEFLKELSSVVGITTDLLVQKINIVFFFVVYIKPLFIKYIILIKINLIP